MFDGVEDRRVVVLREARDALAQPGAWFSGGYASGEARCAIAWINHMACFLEIAAECMEQMALAMPWYWRAVGLDAGPMGVLAVYNDVWWRSQRDMIRLFDRAIAQLNREIAHAT